MRKFGPANKSGVYGALTDDLFLERRISDKAGELLQTRLSDQPFHLPMRPSNQAGRRNLAGTAAVNMRTGIDRLQWHVHKSAWAPVLRWHHQHMNGVQCAANLA